ncbi:hypothetical protein CYY_002225 [Polysphondylium violaceum]|uniref:Peptidase S49 domain-containing protein n=1 Tax=Polysphondylium violaceum TaxID=133409 RepID=A0A8J4V0Z5_9MYCE|nr:hypothetical protein CYY_002225 [Polysphondylium violaceum]
MGSKQQQLVDLCKNVDLGKIVKFINDRPSLKFFLVSTTVTSLYSLLSKFANRVRQNTVIEIDLSGDIEFTNIEPNPIEKIVDRGVVYFRDLIEGIEKAANDKRIIGLIVKLGGNLKLSFADIQEFRASIQYFKSKGKKSVCYADSFNEFSTGIAHYYIASVFNDVYIAPSGTVNIINPKFNFPFIKKTLDKLGCLPEFFKRKEYKSAANTLTEEQMTEAEKESLKALFADLYAQISGDISKDRSIPLETLHQLFESGPFNSDKALVSKLVDSTLYKDEVYNVTSEKLSSISKKLNYLFLNKYNTLTPALYSKRNKNHTFAYISAEGAIYRGVGKNRLNGGPTIGGESLSLAIRSAALDKNIKAIIIRVNSPGGSYIASDTVHHEIEQAKAKGKKVVVSMGTYAASGGYFISCNADKIVAQPATITGSIGVICGKINVKQMFEKIGVTYDSLLFNENGKGEHSTLFSALDSYTEKEEAEINNFLDFIYQDFTTKVAKGRRLNLPQVEEVARGRVWTGKQAFERGLVDKLGGLHEAIELAKELTNAPQTVTPHIVKYPKENLVSLLASSKPPRNSEELDKRGTPSSMIAASPLSLVSTISRVSSFVQGFSGISNILIKSLSPFTQSNDLAHCSIDSHPASLIEF